ncbi:MAG: Crp/Fnr family transcriptional regulator [Flavobacteriaceae bacterium]
MIENLELPDALLQEINKNATVLPVPKNTTLVSIGDVMNFIPFVKSGVVRVYIDNIEIDKEQLLYYLGSGQTCLMSMIASFKDKKSKVAAVTETDCEIIRIPNQNVREWQKKYKEWNDFILNLFINQYQSLLETIDELSFKKIDERLLTYLEKNKDKSHIVDLHKSHLNISKDLATSREVITRTLKKLVVDKKIKKIEANKYEIL